MTRCEFFTENDRITGFSISGHSGYAEQGSDIVCASVSSSAYMAANTVTEIIGADAQIALDDGYLKFTVETDDEFVQVVLKGLQLHVNALADDYSDYIVCKTKTV